MEKRSKNSIFRREMTIAILCLLIGTSIIPGINANVNHNNASMLVSYSFKKPTVETVDIGGNIYKRVMAPDLTPAGNPGEPMIPARGAYILLPPNSKDDSITVIPGEKQIIGTGFIVEPMGKALPISEKFLSSIPTPDKSIYESNLSYPGRLYSKVGTYIFRGYQILVLLLYPIQYNPVTGELYYYKNMNVMIKTTHVNEEQNVLFRGLKIDEKDVVSKVDNPELVGLYQERAKTAQLSTDQKYKLLILTTNDLKEGFEPLKKVHDERGDLTVIKTLADVGGNKNPENIRSYIRDAYMNLGIEYVLIGGDTDVVPAKMLWVSGMDEDTDYYETYMPSDLYYACLDGTYNYDNDNKWGESTDGEGGGDVDLMAEVYVGRACVGSTAEVDNFVSKTVTYMNKAKGTDHYLDKVCLAGEYAGDYGVATFGGSYLNQLIDGSTDDGYTTVGIPSDKYDIDTLYDRDWPGWSHGNPWNTGWSKSELIDRINSGLHIIQHNGHANYQYNMKMVSSDINYLSNFDTPCFIYSDGCMSGGFDHGDCFAEYFTVKNDTGAFAGIWNARYGFFWSYRTDGDSQRFIREFWDAVFGRDISQIGKANQYSREDNLYIIHRSCIRWVYYEINLFGDPLVSLHISNPPGKPALPSGKTRGEIGGNYTHSTSTTDPENDPVYYKWNWGDSTTSDWLGPYDSGEKISISHVWNHKGNYEISVRAKDTHGEESPWSDPLSVSMPRDYTLNSQFIWIFYKFIDSLWGQLLKIKI